MHTLFRTPTPRPPPTHSHRYWHTLSAKKEIEKRRTHNFNLAFQVTLHENEHVLLLSQKDDEAGRRRWSRVGGGGGSGLGCWLAATTADNNKRPS